MLRIYNTLTRRKEEFAPIHKQWVGLYTCGPTVYDYAHIGNLRTYVFEDVLERVLKMEGYRVRRVMNVTDVGHLTSDEDFGEDKVERSAKTKGKSVKDLTRFFTDAFLADLAALNVARPRFMPRASDYIKDYIRLIERLIAQGNAYETAQGVYFDVTTFPRYTKLSGQPLTSQRTAREEVVHDPEKRNRQDFALWLKTVGKFKHHLMQWHSPWGNGFPGWHIECSVISSQFLGQPFDIHTGGVDHIPVHHTNEIAQSEAAYGKPLARYWMHSEFLRINGGRMGKSEGNALTLKNVVQGMDPLTYRYFVLSAHYRTQLNFTDKSFRAADNAYRNLRLKTWILTTPRKSGVREGRETLWRRLGIFWTEFQNALSDDLNMPEALSALHRLVDQLLALHAAEPFGRAEAENVRKTLQNADKVLGLNLAIPLSVPKNVEKLAKLRERLRRNQQFVQSDALRKKIRRLGYEIEDTPAGPFPYASASKTSPAGPRSRNVGSRGSHAGHARNRPRRRRP